MRHTVISTTIAALLALGARGAAAQDYDDEDAGKPATGFGAAVSLGAGLTDFQEGRMQDLTSPGAAYDVRVSLGTRQRLAFEAAYVGSAQDVDALGLDGDAVLLSNGVEGDLRLNLIDLRHRHHLIQPFIDAGAGWSRYEIVGEDANTSSLQNSDDVLALRFGGGLAVYNLGADGLVLDARFTYRATADEELAGEDLAGDVGMDSWAVTGRVGYEF